MELFREERALQHGRQRIELVMRGADVVVTVAALAVNVTENLREVRTASP
jgi:hypothetical protein